MQRQSLDGIYNILKPTGMTSSDAVLVLRGILRNQLGIKVTTGHLGTLDPGASGVLNIACGNATKLFQHFLEKEKKYRASFSFGLTTDTLDSYGKITEQKTEVTENDIINCIPHQIGDIEQYPPQFSAKSINGVKAYKLARSGQLVDLKSKKVTIKNINYLYKTDDNRYLFDIICSSGTYIRSIVRDMAEDMGTCGYMTSLIRTQCGLFEIKNASTLEEIKEDYTKGFMSTEDYSSLFPVVTIKEENRKQLENGVRLVVNVEDGYYKIICKDAYGFGQVIESKLFVILRF